MAIERTRSKRKSTGGRLVAYRKGRQFAVVNQPTLTKIGETKTRTERTLGGKSKQKMLSVKKISVADPTSGKVTLVDIDSVAENKANRNYQIRNILNKGAIVQTKLGNVRVTSRPGQYATLSGVLIK
ncbi:MAG: 30S ribosomal protein S8e [Candidatus Woesearchaeota archaeon]